MSNVVDGVRAAWMKGVPLVSIATPDPAATMRVVRDALMLEKEKPALVRWDIASGVVAISTGVAELDKVSTEAAAKILGNADPSALTNPGEMMIAAARLPKNSILFILNAHRYLGAGVPNNEVVAQAVWNLRDAYKRNGRILILLAPDLVLPADLASDVVPLIEEYPDDVRLGVVMDGVLKACKPEPIVLPEADRARALDALRGLPAFPAEQVVAMATAGAVLDLPAMWERKRTMIEQTGGLRVYRGTETFADIGGNEAVKQFGDRLMQGENPPRVFVHLDEMEKAFAGSAGPLADSSGVSQDALGVILSSMEDNDWYGLVAYGVQGSGKSLLAKAMGNTYARPTIRLDLGGMKSKWVGSSEGAVRAAMRMISAIAGPGGACFVGTCNGLWSLPPELRRRFRLGIWFFDTPDAAEREAIWKIILKRYKLSAKLARPLDEGWTGAEIRTCADIAWRLSIPLTEASAYVVPVSRHSPEAIKAMREVAHSRFLSASNSGVYLMPSAESDDPVPQRVIRDGGPAASGAAGYL